MRPCLDYRCAKKGKLQPFSNFGETPRGTPRRICKACTARRDAEAQERRDRRNERRRNAYEPPSLNPNAMYRQWFNTENEFNAAMRRADDLERRGCPLRASRVRLNVDSMLTPLKAYR